MERRLAWRLEEEDEAEEERLISGKPGEAKQKTLWLATSRRRRWWLKNFCTEDEQRYRSQLKRTVKPVRVKM